MANDDPTDAAENRLLEAFLATDEAEAWQDFGDAAAEKVYDSTVETVEVPAAFLRLVLPEIRTNPHIFTAMNQAWNRVCDAQGMPERKFAGIEPPPADDSQETGAGEF